ncbi:MAG: sulfotransferase domain-containing protein [Vicingaceae bacterium]|nr:sulfotransferase domain-containing protein [Vicingaceae bacterium]
MNIKLGVNIEKTFDDTVVPKINSYFHFTSNYRIKPSFFIIGVQKGGTTSLSKYLEQHTEVIPAQRKDVFYFNNDSHYQKGINWYKAHFALKAYKKIYDLKNNTNAITYDSTPNYFDIPEAAQRIHSFNPNAKLILLLRNPIDRAWSNYQMAKKFGFETLSFEEALKLENDRLNLPNQTHNYIYQRLSYKKRGIYINNIKPWINTFSKENILILNSESLFKDTANTYNKILDFLNLKPTKKIDFKPINQGNYSEKMNPKTREMLVNFYQPFNQELYNLLDVDYGWK